MMIWPSGLGSEMLTILASIPSPSSNQLEIGPLNLRFYGLTIAFGVLAAVWLSQRRWEARGGDPEDIVSIAFVAVPAGLVGARLYHVITDWKKFEGDWLSAFKIWEGGLGIPGGMAIGFVAGLLYVRHRNLPARPLIDAIAPALPLAQAIGRFGNWFNQELFGRPTDLPWGLEIDAQNRPAEHLDVETFHPTFLYESLWNLGLCGLLILIDRRRVLAPGKLIFVYVLGYGIGRLWVELLRVDPASEILGVRVNVWVSLFAIVVSTIALLWGRGRDEVADEFTDLETLSTEDDATDLEELSVEDDDS
jgi:prolipoprotein diacylglyceryl transferase